MGFLGSLGKLLPVLNLSGVAKTIDFADSVMD
jgi:hypothetical protein